MIQQKLKPCKTCLSPSYIFSHGNCKYCSQMAKIKSDRGQATLTQTENGRTAKAFKVYSTKAIKQVSTRQQKLNAAYSAQRKVYLKNHRICEAGLTNCTLEATTVHHKIGRMGSYLLDERFWLPCCMSCHEYIERKPAEAKARGLSLDRLNKII